MAVVVPGIPTLAAADLDLFSTTDPLLCNSPVMVFHGEHMTTLVSASSRIQLHIYTPAGFESYPRLSVTPTSPYYASVKALPREEQGDEVCRGIAFGLAKYFAELPLEIKDAWLSYVYPTKSAPSTKSLFSPTHVAVLASRMTRIERSQAVIDQLARSLGPQKISWLDLDVVLPPGSITPQDSILRSDSTTEQEETKLRYGKYHFIATAVGERTFLPTSKIKRAPSKPTTLGRSNTFSQHQKEMVRKEMCELVDTEDSYVQKLVTLVNNAAIPVRNKAHSADIALAQGLFPDSLDRIVRINSDLLDALREVLDTTEEAAIADIEQSPTGPTTVAPDDSIGIADFARVLVDHLPEFGQDYAHFMAGHTKCAELIRTLCKSVDPTINDIVHNFGEQRLASTLIEPIQRLPRYSLYIDTITKQLPLGHRALQPLLKARDMVTEICLRDDGGQVLPPIEKRLAHLVQAWPDSPPKLGRLISAADALRLNPPFSTDGQDNTHVICLLFTNALIVLEKLESGAQSARSFQTELQNLNYVNDSSLYATQNISSLRFLTTFDIHSATITECLDAQAIAVTQRRSADTVPAQPPLVLFLQGNYASKVSRFAEEIAKARIEGRFSDAEREDGRWDIRSAIRPQDEVNIFGAIFDADDRERDKVAAFRLVVDAERSTGLVDPGQNGLDMLISVDPLGDGLWQLGVKDKGGLIARDRVSEADFPGVLAKRLSGLLLSRSTIRDPAMMPSLIAQNDQILKSLAASAMTPVIGKYTIPSPTLSGPPDRLHRPHSPVKTLSTFLSSIGPGAAVSASRKSPGVEAPPHSQNERAMSVESRRSKEPTPGPVSRPGSGDSAASPSNRIRETFSTYLLALHARKGNVVGRVIKARRNTDGRVVESLYNTLLREPSMIAAAAESSVDVLFMSFERFLRVAWTEHFGAILPDGALTTMRSRAHDASAVDFGRHLKETIATLAAPNREALKGIMRLLADLLEGTDNDIDRGALTAVFAEMIIQTDDPHSFISLIDRCVRDVDLLFATPAPASDLGSRSESRMTTERPKSTHYGSLTAKSSSLRTKFGFGSLARDNSMRENHRPGLDKVGSVWRTISKSTNASEAPAVLTGPTVQRAKSTDIDARVTPRRTPRQEMINSLGDFSWEKSRASKESQSVLQTSPLCTIGESRNKDPAPKKRRSSLSDVVTPSKLEVSLQSPCGLKRLDVSHAPDENANGKASSPYKPAASSAAKRLSIIDANFPSRLPSIRRGPSPSKPQAADETRGTVLRDLSNRRDEVTMKTSTPSGRPTPSREAPITDGRKPASDTRARSGLSENPTAGNAMKSRTYTGPEKMGSMADTARATTSTKKLKMQSPQKLRERLQQEQRLVTTAQTTLQEEIGKLSEEMSKSAEKSGPVLKTCSATTPSSDQITTRLAGLQETLDRTMTELKARTAAMQADFASSLTISENKSKSLDALYREANAENEALYVRFNAELSKVVRAVRGGEGVEELKRTVNEGHQERERLRRENARLKREVVGLRCQLRD